MNRGCLFIFMSIGSRRKESEISGICLFLVTHLNHELTRAAYELRVWVRARALFENPSPALRATVPTATDENNFESTQLIFLHCITYFDLKIYNNISLILEHRLIYYI